MSPVSFQKVERPTVTRSRKANPYLDTVKELAADLSQTVAVSDLPYTTEDEVKSVHAMIGQVQSAGRELGVSIRKLIEVAEKKNGKQVTKTATVTLWAVEAIKRPRSLD